MFQIEYERTKTLLKRRGIGKSKHFKDIAEGLWVRPSKNGRASLNLIHESNQLLAAIAVEATPDELRALVNQLHEERKRLPEIVARAA